MSARFFINNLLETGKKMSLSGKTARHIKQVLRSKVGDEIRLFNGQGGEFSATVLAFQKQQVLVGIQHHHLVDRCPNLQITLAQAITRNQRMDFTVQKSTELGVFEIIPLITKFVNVRLNKEQQTLKSDHWQRVITSACEQCGRNRLPVLQAPINFPDWIKHAQTDMHLIFHPEQGESFSSLYPPKDKRVSLLLGPEGGFSDEEFELALASGWQPVTLGPRLLRTETATAVVMSICQLLWGDLGYTH